MNEPLDIEGDPEIRREYMSLGLAVRNAAAAVPLAAENRKRSGTSVSREVATGVVRQLADEIRPGQSRNELRSILGTSDNATLGACRELQMFLAAVDRLVFIGCPPPAAAELVEGHQDALKRRALRVVEPGIPPSQLTEARITRYLELYFHACRVGSQMPLAWLAARLASGAPDAVTRQLTMYATGRALRRTLVTLSVLRGYGVDARLP